jgi:hypothetical protein
MLKKSSQDWFRSSLTGFYPNVRFQEAGCTEPMTDMGAKPPIL